MFLHEAFPPGPPMVKQLKREKCRHLSLWDEINVNTYPFFSFSCRCLLCMPFLISWPGASREWALPGLNSAQKPKIKSVVQKEKQNLLMFGESTKVPCRGDRRYQCCCFLFHVCDRCHLEPSSFSLWLLDFKQKLKWCLTLSEKCQKNWVPQRMHIYSYSDNSQILHIILRRFTENNGPWLWGSKVQKACLKAGAPVLMPPDDYPPHHSLPSHPPQQAWFQQRVACLLNCHHEPLGSCSLGPGEQPHSFKQILS